MFSRRSVRLILLQMIAWAFVYAQMEIGQISGTITDPSGASLVNARVVLQNPLTSRESSAVSDTGGNFRFENVPYGAYILRASANGFAPASRQISVRSNVPVVVPFRLAIAAEGTEVTVHPDVMQADTTRTDVVLDENTIKLTPGVVRRDQVQSVVSTTPGWNTENDGLMHIRGVDDGTLYVVNGIPTPDRVDGVFAGSFNPDAITSLDVITGNIPASSEIARGQSSSFSRSQD